MMKRMICGFMSLILLVALCVTFGRTDSAKATDSSYFVIPNSRIATINAMPSGDLSMTSCGLSINSGAYYRQSNGSMTALPSYSDRHVFCDQNMGEPSADTSGTYYATQMDDYSSSRVTAWRNGRELWSADTTSPTNCGSGYADYVGMPSSISIGADGNVYMLLGPDARPTSCPDRMVGLNAQTGVRVFDDITLTSGPVSGSGIYPVTAHLWTYSDKILVIDRNGVLKTFHYDGTEDTSKRYTFPVPTNKGIEQVIANAAGTVFAAVFPEWESSYAAAPLLYHEDNGDTGSFDTMPYASENPHPLLRLTANGNVVSFGASEGLVEYDVANGTTSTISIPNTSNYPSSSVIDYTEDAYGDGLLLRRLWDSSGNYAVSVDVVSGSTHTLTNKFFLGKDPGDSASPNPRLLSTRIDESISGGYLYLSLCLDDAAGTCSTTSASSSIYKVPIESGFYDPIQNRQNFGNYASSGRNYVAMGDSYSSGEGNPPFYAASDQQNPYQNRCHRGPVSYAQELVDTTYLNLHLVDFTACSGAKTSDVYIGGNTGVGAWGESAQVGALSANTDVATLTIGGNDVGFRDYIYGCSLAVCGAGTADYQNAMSNIDDPLFTTHLEATYSATLAHAPNANIYVADYPYMTPDGVQDCGLIDVSGLYSLTTELDAKIKDAVNDIAVNHSKLHFVEVNYDQSPFDGKYLCTGDSDFNDLETHTDPGGNGTSHSYSFHPNSAGQAAYATIFGDAIATN